MKYRNMMCSGAISMAMAFGCGGDDGPTNPDSAGDDTDGMEETGDDPPDVPPGTTSSEPGDDTDDDDDDDDTGPEVDVEPPHVLSVSPSDGETGVRAHTEIVVTFSEPMDQAATEAAYQSTDLPAEEVTMTWNEDGDELTITPADPLALGEGLDPDVVEAISYAIMIDTAAQDLAGNALEEDYAFEFSTARMIIGAHPLDMPRSGCMDANGDTNDVAVCAGDGGDQAGAHLKGFATFDISGLPEDIIELAAELQMYQVWIVGEPYDSLGDLTLHHVEYTDMVIDEFDAPPLAEIGVFSDSPELGERKLDVSESVWNDYEAERETSQYRLEFEVANDLDDEPDGVMFLKHASDDYPAPRIVVLYLIP
jgi:hypothetical protein